LLLNIFSILATYGHKRNWRATGSLEVCHIQYTLSLGEGPRYTAVFRHEKRLALDVASRLKLISKVGHQASAIENCVLPCLFFSVLIWSGAVAHFSDGDGGAWDPYDDDACGRGDGAAHCSDCVRGSSPGGGSGVLRSGYCPAGPLLLRHQWCIAGLLAR